MKVIDSQHTGPTVVDASGHQFTLTRAQARAMSVFCLDPTLGEGEVLSVAAGHKAGVEVASCTPGKYTVLFTENGNVNGEWVGLAEIRKLGADLAGALDK